MKYRVFFNLASRLPLLLSHIMFVLYRRSIVLFIDSIVVQDLPPNAVMLTVCDTWISSSLLCDWTGGESRPRNVFRTKTQTIQLSQTCEKSAPAPAPAPSTPPPPPPAPRTICPPSPHPPPPPPLATPPEKCWCGFWWYLPPKLPEGTPLRSFTRETVIVGTSWPFWGRFYSASLTGFSLLGSH